MRKEGGRCSEAMNLMKLQGSFMHRGTLREFRRAIHIATNTGLLRKGAGRGSGERYEGKYVMAMGPLLVVTGKFPAGPALHPCHSPPGAACAGL